jgi:hypothetical protein
MHSASGLGHYFFRDCCYLQLSILAGPVERKFLRTLSPAYQTPWPATMAPAHPRATQSRTPYVGTVSLEIKTFTPIGYLIAADYQFIR